MWFWKWLDFNIHFTFFLIKPFILHCCGSEFNDQIWLWNTDFEGISTIWVSKVSFKAEQLVLAICSFSNIMKSKICFQFKVILKKMESFLWSRFPWPCDSIHGYFHSISAHKRVIYYLKYFDFQFKVNDSDFDASFCKVSNLFHHLLLFIENSSFILLSVGEQTLLLFHVCGFWMWYKTSSKKINILSKFQSIGLMHTYMCFLLFRKVSLSTDF